MLEAVNDFILQYTDVVQDNLYRGYQNRSTLPQVNDYTMFYEQSVNRIGTNVDEVKNTETEIKTLREYTVNIDFCGDDQENGSHSFGESRLGRQLLCLWRHP